MSVISRDITALTHHLYVKNNDLHNAIQKGNHDEAIALINSDINGQLINSRGAFNNTPLLFALKTGAFSVVAALLNHPKIIDSIEVADDRGLTPLHWACIFRQTDIIRTLLDLGAKDLQTEKLRGEPRTNLGYWPKPSTLYSHPIDSSYLIHHYILRPPETTAFYHSVITEQELSMRVHSSHRFFVYRVDSPQSATKYDHVGYYFNYELGHSIKATSGFRDNTMFEISGTPWVSDLVFHMMPICLNNGIKGLSDFSKALEYFSTDPQLFYYHAFGEGLYPFCAWRDAILVDESLLKQFIEYEYAQTSLNKFTKS